MGVIQFHVQRPDLLARAGGCSMMDFLMYDGRIAPADVVLQGDRMICRRSVSESGQFRLPWPRFSGGSQVVHSTSLREQSEPYELELELARGQLSRLRNQFSIWHGSGLQTSPRLDELIRESHRSFRAAALRAEVPETSAAAAVLSMELSAQAADMLCEHYVSQRIEFRRQRSSRIPVLMGCHLRQIPQQQSEFLQTFNAVQVNTDWQSIESDEGVHDWSGIDALVEWAQEHRLFVMGGPLLDLTQDCLPQWMRNWSRSRQNLQSFAADFVETILGRYQGRIRHWEVVTGGNRGGAFGMTEEERIRFISALLLAVRGVDDTVQVSLRVVQPWGEYLNEVPSSLSPVQFFDTLRRCGVRIGEINLDLRLSQSRLHCLRRDALSLSLLIDHWSLFQVPLNVMITVPPVSSQNTEMQREDWLRNVLLMCLSKERVTGIWLSDWQDGSEAADGAALIGADGQPDSSLKLLQKLTRELLW